MSAENAWRIAREQCASIAQNACLVPPDGGSPSEEDRVMCAIAAEYIMEAPMPPAFRAEVEAEMGEVVEMLREAREEMRWVVWPNNEEPALMAHIDAVLSRLEAKGESHE